jgi:hypothetical protein
MLQGHLENIQEDGLITGWCWDPDHPATRAELTVLVDNEPVGRLIADHFRADLESAGIGDGAHAFAFLLPWSAVARKSVTSVHVADPADHRPIGGALTFRRAALLPIEQRLAEVEHNTRLLRARLDEANRQALRATALMQSTLATIGAFFTQLAEMPLDALPQPGLSGVHGLLTSARTEFEPFAFAVPATPRMTICVSGAGDLGAVYGCLRALKACGLDDQADIVVIDSGASPETALIPLLVHNLRYWPVSAGQSLLAARNRLTQTAAGELLLFLSPAMRMRPGWLEAARATLAAQPRGAVLGSAVLHADGTVQSSGLTADAAGRLTDAAYAERADAAWHNRLAPVAAVPDHALLIRQTAFTEVEGFDPAYVDPAAAATDLCLRCWAAGHAVLYNPAAALDWAEDAAAPMPARDMGQDMGLDALLAERWRQTARAAWPAPIGRALIIGAHAADAPPHSMEALQQLGYDIAFGTVPGLAAEDTGGSALRAIGVEVLKAPDCPSVIAAIKAAAPAFDIIQLSPAALASLSPETIRALAPGARIVVALDAAPPPPDGPLAQALAAADAILAPQAEVSDAPATATPTVAQWLAAWRGLTSGPKRGGAKPAAPKPAAPKPAAPKRSAPKRSAPGRARR